MTDRDRAAVERIITQADGLAARILAVEIPDIGSYRALAGLVALARGTGIFTPSDRHLRALQRLPPEPDVRVWRDQEAKLSALRG